MENITAGPRTSNHEFLTKHLNLSIKEMKKAAELAKSGDINSAEKVFADYVRNALEPQRLLKDWQRPKSAEAFAQLKERVESIKEYTFAPCRIPHTFKDKRIDWLGNPTYNNYCEWPWQLSRHHEFDILAEYYYRTKDEEIAKLWVDMIGSWFMQAIVPEDGTPGNKTICWRTIETGIRMHGWSQQIHSFINSRYVTDSFITRYFASIYEHGHRLRIACTHGNWLLMEMHGLVRIGVLYKFIGESDEWESYALSRLAEEMDMQIYPDGFQYELSTDYHGVVDHSYYYVLRIYRDMGLEAPEFLEEKLEKLYDVYPALVRPDGRLPDINDGSTMSIKGKMGIASSLYPDRDDFRWYATDKKEGHEPDFLSYAFPYAGAVVMRTDRTENAIWAYMDASPFGKAHQHEDKLNVLISAYGKNMINEAGNFDYDTSETRKYVLDTRAHNTIRINSNGQNQRPGYVWDPADINKKAELDFKVTDEKEYARAEYNAGYGSELDKTVHERKLIFYKKVEGLAPFFAVVDRLTAPDSNERTYESQWHYENCDFKIDGLRANGDFGDGVGLTALFSDENAEVVDMMGQYEPYYQGWFPIRPSGPHEHRRVPTPILCGSFEGSRRIVTVLYPYKNGEDIVESVRASSDVASTDFVIVLKDGKEIKIEE